MDARFISSKQSLVFSLAILLVVGCLLTKQTQAAGARTVNFLIDAPTPQLARQVADAAERYRRDLAIYWLGRELPPWPTPCPIRVIAGEYLAAQGVTTYNRAPVRDFQMEVVGTPARILDSVLPHEVTHTILATHFGRPLPRWADEGICTTVEHVSEKNKHEAKLREFLHSRRGIAMNKLFLMTEYPSDVLPMYAQGYSVCRFLIEQKDASTFIEFLTDYMQRPSWTENVRKHYGYDSLAELQEYWLAWVSAGSGPVGNFAKVDRSTAGNDSQVALAASTLFSSNAAVTPIPASPSIKPPKDQLAATASQPKFPSMLGLLQPPLNAQPIDSATATAATLASQSERGWYQRQKQTAEQVAQDDRRQGQPQNLPSAVTPIMPPSVRQSGPYSVSQPQPEMRVSRGGAIPSYPANGYPMRRLVVPSANDLEGHGGDTGLRGDFQLLQWPDRSARYR